jgi:dihydrofolate reductase
MRKIIAITQVTLDGVMQSPGGREEDPTNGFAHGGWAMSFLDDALSQAIGETIAGEFDMLLGRRTYEIFAAYWPNQGDNSIAKAFNRATKYVVTRSLDRFDWENSQRIGGDVVDEIRRLKASDGPALHIWGSGELLQTLIAAELIDEYHIWIGARRRKAAARERRSAARPCPGRDAKHAQGRPHQYLPLGRSAPSRPCTQSS